MADADDVKQAIADMRKDVCDHLHEIVGKVGKIESNQVTLANEVAKVSGMTQRFSGEVSTLKKRVDHLSTVDRQHSDSDLKQAADIAATIGHQQKLHERLDKIEQDNAKQTESTTKLAHWQNHPLIKIAGAIVGAAIASYVAASQGRQAPLPAPAPIVVPSGGVQR